MQENSHNKLLLFQVGPVKCSLYSNDILTIIPPPKQETAGKTGRLPGIFRHDNHIVRVVDMRSKFGLSPSDPERGRVIIAQLDKGRYAFWVDRVLNVIDQEEGRWDIVPPALPREVFIRTFIMDEEIILHTECARMEAMTPSAGLTQHIKALEAKQAEVRTPTRPAAPQPAPSRETEPTPPRTEETETQVQRPAITPTPRPAPTPATATARPSQAAGTRPTVETEKKPVTPPAPATPSKPLSPARAEIEKPARPTPIPPPRPTPTERAAPVAPRPATSTESFPSRAPTPPPPAPPSISSGGAASRESTATTRPQYEDEGEGGLGWLIAIILLLLVLGGAAVFYINTGFERKTPSMARYETPEAEVAPPPSYAPPEPPQVVEPEPEPIAAAEPEPLVSEAQAPQTEPEPTVPVEDAAGSEATTETTEPFSAAIAKEDRVLTITLKGPEDESVRPLIKDEASEAPVEPAPTQDQAAAMSEPEPTIEPATEAEPQAEAEPPVKQEAATRPRREITHVVVKGDTLWDIAERYVKDPFRYPELARLSGIKNPDLIYPGDIVRIIEK